MNAVSLPLKVHTLLPRRPWDWKFKRLPETLPYRQANTLLFKHYKKINVAYSSLLSSAEYQRFVDPAFTEKYGKIDSLILPFISALSQMAHIRPWESCQGLFHTKEATLNPRISYHPLTGTTLEQIYDQEKDLAKIACFLKDGPQDTYYLWQIIGHQYFGRLTLGITIPGLQMDPDLAIPPFVADSIAFRPLSQKIYDRVVHDINSLTLGFLLLQSIYGRGLEGFPPQDFYK
jgi:hypothetical protein